MHTACHPAYILIPLRGTKLNLEGIESMGLMNDARRELQRLIAEAVPGDRVTSVRSLSAAVGDLTTSPTVAVLQEAIRDGWIYSTRGPKGGYWRTDKQLGIGIAEVPEEIAEALEEYERCRRAEQSAWQTLRGLLATER